MRRAVALATRLYGEDHIEVYETQAELGLALSGAGAWDEAEELLRTAILRSSAGLGIVHPTTAGLQEALGTLLLWRYEYDEAVILLQLALEEKVYRHENRDHPGVVASLVRVAEALAGAGRFEEARDYVGRADRMIVRLETNPSVYSISAEQTLGKIAAAEGDAEKAERHFLRSIELAETLLARPDHRYTLGAKRDYAVFLTSVGRRQEAAEILDRVLEAQLHTLGEPHPMVERTRAALSAARSG